MAPKAIPQPTPNPDTRHLLDVPAAAARYGLNPRTVRRMFDERALPIVKLGRRVFVWSDDLAEHLEAATVPARIGGTR